LSAAVRQFVDERYQQLTAPLTLVEKLAKKAGKKSAMKK
jgi:hypothetical protein